MTSIQVAVRVRPLKSGETATNNMEIISDSRRVIFGPKVFDCDILLDPETTQTQLFNNACKNIVDNVMEGQRGTILVYGQTGTGKTHTMFGPPDAPNGVVFNSIQHILGGERNRELSISLSVLEVYLEKVTDLFSSKEVPVFCGQPRNVVWRPVSNVQEASDAIFQALEARHIAATAMNERSSRSHVIVNVKVLRSSTSEVDDEGNAKIEASNLLLVDLAGSECLGKSKAVGKAAHEASSINKSLLALKQIILALSSANQAQNNHIPYRDSKLTELLQDSIGGCSRTMMVACISPAARDVEETKSTLEYATKARQIKNLAQTDRERMLIKIKSLEFELQKARNRLEQQSQERGVVVVTKTEYDELQQMATRVEELRAELQKQYEEKDKAENYRHYHAGVQKQLREELSAMQEKRDEAVAERGFISKSIQDIIAQMRSELAVTFRSYEEAVLHRMQAVCSAVEGAQIPASSIEEFKGFSTKLSEYANASVKSIIENVSHAIQRSVSNLQACLAEDEAQRARHQEMTQLLQTLTKLHEAHTEYYTSSRVDKYQEIVHALDLTKTSLEKQPTDFVAYDALQSAFLKEAEQYRATAIDAVHQTMQECTLPTPSFNDILMRGEKKATQAALAPKKRGREAGVGDATNATALAENVPSSATVSLVATVGAPTAPIVSFAGSASQRSNTSVPEVSSGSITSRTATTRSQTPNTANNAKRKKTVFGNATNITA